MTLEVNRKNTIRKKLILIIMGVTLTVLVAERIAQSISAYYGMRAEVRSKIVVTADLAGKNIASALDFLDAEAAIQNLSSFSYEESIFRACIYNKEGGLFAQYTKSAAKKTKYHTDGTDACPEEKSYGLSETNFNDVHVVRPITANGAQLGWLFIDYDLTKEHRAFMHEQLVAFAILVMALLIAYILAVRLQKLITVPLLDLSNVASALSSKRDYSIRAKKTSDDEIGILVDAFNAMLDGIERRDSALHVAKGVAERANELKGQFLATMSHEIRTPMTGILGMAELLLGSNLNQRQESHARTIVSSGESLLNIINDILDFSKIEAGKLELDPIAVDLLELVDDVGMLFSVKAREKAVELVVNYKPGTEQFVFADPVRVRQIIGNLLSNAIKFTDKGHIVLSIEEDKSANVPDDDVQILVSVQDTGVGIEENMRAQIFEKFSQADASTTRKFGGTGLGLAICRNLVEMMGGKIWVDSKVGYGAKFSFTLPCKRNNVEVRPVPDVAALKDARVLVVDDLTVNLDLVAALLNEAGARCEAALSGEKALEKMAKAQGDGDPYGIVVIDYLMPDMNGEMLACAIKDDPALADTCLVMLTAAGNPNAGEMYSDKGFSAYMAKPVQNHAFVRGLAIVWEKYEGGVKDVLIRLDTNMLGKTHDDQDELKLPEARILLAEDNLVNQVFIQEILQEMECHLVVVQNGREAIETLRENEYDLVLMDCLMPVLDGFEATREICAMKEQGKIAAELPVVALTANAMKGDREKCLAAGMDEYITKPVRKQHLKAVVYKWVTGKDAPIDDGGDQGTAEVSEDLLDYESIENARNILKDKYDNMITLYISNSHERIQEILDAVQSNDAEAVIRPAHTLKSTSKQMGALKLSGLAKDVELAAKALAEGEGADDFAKILESMEDIKRTLEETGEAFERMAA